MLFFGISTALPSPLWVMMTAVTAGRPAFFGGCLPRQSPSQVFLEKVLQGGNRFFFRGTFGLHSDRIALFCG